MDVNLSRFTSWQRGVATVRSTSRWYCGDSQWKWSDRRTTSEDCFYLVQLSSYDQPVHQRKATVRCYCSIQYV